MAKQQTLGRLAGLLSLCLVWWCPSASGQTATDEQQFGPVVRAYLGYLRNEQQVVDDRVSRREVSQYYYRRNSNRIHALRQMAMRIAEESRNDYLPELEAVAGDELNILFEHPPSLQTLQVGEVLRAKFRYLGTVRSREVFYVFARLDPYEQAEVMAPAENQFGAAGNPEGANPGGITRSRRVKSP